jgi:hypothetical protein
MGYYPSRKRQMQLADLVCAILRELGKDFTIEVDDDDDLLSDLRCVARYGNAEIAISMEPDGSELCLLDVRAYALRKSVCVEHVDLADPESLSEINDILEEWDA